MLLLIDVHKGVSVNRNQYALGMMSLTLLLARTCSEDSRPGMYETAEGHMV